ncbi:unnamed protein product [Eruca vesicaria subsp. sativa]|uniref:Uncharacterized protein n=1 Tax=Eruca vesicaria subsp. sativa TaxID=29727 RepID=A0ABC8KDV8_ERUVS|nr:unnamed protein product [Eruca vesicaria subsp. sativa]
MAVNHFQGSFLQDAFTDGMNDRTKHYRRILKMYKEFHEAVVSYNNAEGNLELFDEIFNDFVMIDVKQELESELELSQARISDVKVPNLNGDKLGEPQMWH